MKILIKAMQPHRQRVLTADGEEIRLQRWANKTANREVGTDRGKVGGAERFTQARDKLMYDAVANPEEHGLKFINERVPFEGQELESSLSDPMNASDIADITDASSAETERAMGGTPDLFDSEGKLRDGMPPEEGKKRGPIYTNVSYDSNVGTPTEEEIDQMTSEQQRGFDANKEAEHMRRIMNSRQVPMRDALSLLKNEPYDWQGQEYDTHCPKCQKGIYRQDEDDLFMIQNAGMCTDCMMPKKAMTSRQVPMRDAWSILKNLQFPADAGNRREFQRMPGEEHGPNDKFFRYGEDPYVPKGHGEKPMREERPHPYSQLGADVMEDHQLMQEEPENNQLLTPDELAFAQLIAENDMRMPPAASIPAPTLRQGMNQYNP